MTGVNIGQQVFADVPFAVGQARGFEIMPIVRIDGESRLISGVETVVGSNKCTLGAFEGI